MFVHVHLALFDKKNLVSSFVELSCVSNVVKDQPVFLQGVLRCEDICDDPTWMLVLAMKPIPTPLFSTTYLLTLPDKPFFLHQQLPQTVKKPVLCLLKKNIESGCSAAPLQKMHRML